MAEWIVRETAMPLATGQEVVGELVRCKDCRWRHDDSNPMWIPCLDIMPDDNWYCADGERREDG